MNRRVSLFNKLFGVRFLLCDALIEPSTKDRTTVSILSFNLLRIKKVVTKEVKTITFLASINYVSNCCKGNVCQVNFTFVLRLNSIFSLVKFKNLDRAELSILLFNSYIKYSSMRKTFKKDDDIQLN